MKIIASNHFIKFKKKSTEALQLEIDAQVLKIIKNPEIGELKKGDLAGIRIHKFNYGSKLFLLSYQSVHNSIKLYMIDSHENFYKRLKKYLN